MITAFLLSHLAAHATPVPTLTPTAPAGSSGGDINALESALIGVGGSVFGGILGGWFALRAVARQSKEERLEARKERSRQAAMSIASAWPALELALLARSEGDITASQLDVAYNSFAQTAALQSIPISDVDLRQRIRNQIELVFPLTNHNTAQATLAQKVESLRQHGDAVRLAITAHYNDEPLPAYTDPREPASIPNR